MKLLVLVLGVGVAGCFAGTMPSIATLPQRQQFLAPQINDAFASQMSCPSARLRFVSTERVDAITGPTYRDLYVAEGCGRRSDFITEVQMVGTAIPPELQRAFLVPAIEEYRTDAHAQSVKTAAFDFGCKDVNSVDLSEQLGIRHASYDASIGEEGCGKRATYHTHCTAARYTAGANQITCNSKQDITVTN